jgi:hypothetical protein
LPTNWNDAALIPLVQSDGAPITTSRRRAAVAPEAFGCAGKVAAR